VEDAMSNIFHEIKRGFLILGFTGPLNSGCTHAAKFFEDRLNKYITDAYRYLPLNESKIQAKYKLLHENKVELDKAHEVSDEYPVSKKEMYNIYGKINKLSNELKQLLNIRETLTVRNEYKNNNFKYISMTDLLLKLTIGNLADTDDRKLDKQLLKLKEQITYDLQKFNKAKDVSRKIKERNIAALDASDINIYEEYLSYVTYYRAEIKKHFNEDELGILLQNLGDNARRCGNPIDYETEFKKENAKTLFVLANEANDLIKFFRNRNRENFQKIIYKQYIIEAFRNPYEIEYFRNRYYEFYLFSINAPLSVRKTRGACSIERDERDSGRNLKAQDFYKQNVSQCVHLSDIAVNNNERTDRLFKRKLSKYFALICRPGCIKPEDDELFMQQAHCMSVESNCISRQVGAVIVGRRGYIVGAGWNDVGSGQIPCGLRRYSDVHIGDALFPLAVKGEENDFAEFIKKSEGNYSHHCYCIKDEYSKFKTDKTFNKPNSDIFLWLKRNKIKDDECNKLSEIEVNSFSPKRLEYCRALHAEENAILQNSIIGGIGIEGGIMYTTTFPCELCAKKIYQSRIKKVVYTEPYPESISEDVFFQDGSHSVELVQFEGVKSYSYYKLFKSPVDKKEFQIQEKLS
jgi:deoxycytidylate deaminase